MVKVSPGFFLDRSFTCPTHLDAIENLSPSLKSEKFVTIKHNKMNLSFFLYTFENGLLGPYVLRGEDFVGSVRN